MQADRLADAFSEDRQQGVGTRLLMAIVDTLAGKVDILDVQQMPAIMEECGNDHRITHPPLAGKVGRLKRMVELGNVGKAIGPVSVGGHALEQFIHSPLAHRHGSSRHLGHTM